MPTLCPLRRILREGSKTSWYECADNTVKVNNPTGCLLKFSINRSKRDENQSCRTFDEVDDLFCHVLSQIKGIEGCSYFFMVLVHIKCPPLRNALMPKFNCA